MDLMIHLNKALVVSLLSLVPFHKWSLFFFFNRMCVGVFKFTMSKIKSHCGVHSTFADFYQDTWSQETNRQRTKREIFPLLLWSMWVFVHLWHFYIYIFWLLQNVSRILIWAPVKWNPKVMESVALNWCCVDDSKYWSL